MLLSAWEEGAWQPPLQRALTLLAVLRPERSAADWARSSIGERDASLLAVREELFGSRLDATAACPHCGEALELTFDTTDLRRAAAGSPAAQDGGAECVIDSEGYEVRYRVPTTADLLEVVGLDAAD